MATERALSINSAQIAESHARLSKQRIEVAGSCLDPNSLMLRRRSDLLFSPSSQVCPNHQEIWSPQEEALRYHAQPRGDGKDDKRSG